MKTKLHHGMTPADEGIAAARRDDAARKDTRTQYRATCAVCFKQHAVKGDKMVDHGYTIPQNWHARQGSCGGATESHFGTPEGLEITKSVRTAYEKYLAEQRTALARVPRIVKIKGVNSHAYKAEPVELTKADGHWFTDAVRRFQFQTESNIRGVEGDIKMLTGFIDAWQPVAPVAVEVETGPTVHMYWERSRERVLCVYSSHRANPTHRHTSKVETDVTCAACLKQLAAMRAEKIVDEKAAALVDAMVAKYGDAVRRQFSDAARDAVKEIRYKMPHVDKAVKKEACRLIER